jgi:hypothetical protein
MFFEWTHWFHMTLTLLGNTMAGIDLNAYFKRTLYVCGGGVDG